MPIIIVLQSTAVQVCSFAERQSTPFVREEYLFRIKIKQQKEKSADNGKKKAER